MGNKQTKASLILAVMFITAIVIVWLSDMPTADSEAPVNFSLPETFGDWKGENIFFCQNGECMKSFRADETGGKTVCPSCGGTFATISLQEKNNLPAGTVILKKRYKNSADEEFFVSVVISSSSRSSIHRPQWCLPGQGYRIGDGNRVTIPIKGRDPLLVMLLDVTRMEPAGNRKGAYAYAYWFVSKRHETSYHFIRIFWMALDNIFRGISQRWAYVSIMTTSDGQTNEHEARMASFIAEFYPLISLERDLP